MLKALRRIFWHKPPPKFVNLSILETVTPTTHGTFGHPTTQVILEFFIGDEKIGTLKGILSATTPSDCLYVDDIKVVESLRRRGYGWSMLVLAALRFKTDITPVHILYSASSFWREATLRLAAHNVHVRNELRTGDLSQEAQRWTRKVA